MKAATNRHGELVIDAELASKLIPMLLDESDEASGLLAQLLVEFGEVLRSTGTYGLDYAAEIRYGGETWLVEVNNGWTRIYCPLDAEYDLDEVLGEREA
jgi:hypothetical protein